MNWQSSRAIRTATITAAILAAMALIEFLVQPQPDAVKWLLGVAVAALVADAWSRRIGTNNAASQPPDAHNPDQAPDRDPAA